MIAHTSSKKCSLNTRKALQRSHHATTSGNEKGSRLPRAPSLYTTLLSTRSKKIIVPPTQVARSAQFRARVGRVRARFGRSRSNFARFPSNLGLGFVSHLAIVCRNRAKFDCIQATFGCFRAESGRSWSVPGQISSMSGPIRSNCAKFGRNRAKASRCRAQCGRSRLIQGKCWSSLA